MAFNSEDNTNMTQFVNNDFEALEDFDFTCSLEFSGQNTRKFAKSKHTPKASTKLYFSLRESRKKNVETQRTEKQRKELRCRKESSRDKQQQYL